MRTLFRG